MSEESETVTDNMSGFKLPEQEKNPQAMRGGGKKENNNNEGSDPKETITGIDGEGNPVMKNLPKGKDELKANASTVDSLVNKVQFSEEADKVEPDKRKRRKTLQESLLP